MLLGRLYFKDEIMSNPYNALCPVCGKPAVSRCRCIIGDFTCANGHEWHRCPMHKKDVVGSAHGSKFFGGCTCGTHVEGVRVRSIK